LNALQVGIPDEENMLVQIKRAGAKIYQFSTTVAKSESLPVFGTIRNVPRTGEPWPKDQLATAQWFLEQNSESAGAIRDAIGLPKRGLRFPWKSPVANTSYWTQLSGIRGAAKSLCLEAGIATELNDRQEAGHLILQMCRLSNWSSEGALIHYLTDISINSLTMDRVERTINRCGLDDEDLRQLIPAVAKMNGMSMLSRAFINERVIYLDTVAGYRTGKIARGRSGSPAATAASYVPVVLAWDAAAGLDAYAALIEAVNGPSEKCLSRAKAIESTPAMAAWYAVTSKTLISSISHSVTMGLRSQGQTRALVAALAAERFRLAKGHWPNSLEELSPTYLDAVPADPLDGKPIRYAIIPEGIKTWTIGGDDNNQDDGGDVQRIESVRTRPKDWGWVILNPELRGRAAPEAPPTNKTPLVTTRAAKG
jgi:hypothetical protein